MPSARKLACLFAENFSELKALRQLYNSFLALFLVKAVQTAYQLKVFLYRKICRDSGMLAGENCTHDLRGSRVTTVEVAIGTQPQETCTMHVMREYCTVGKCLKFPGCTEECIITVALLDYNRPEYYSNGVYDPETGAINPPTMTDANGEIVEMPLNLVTATDDAYVISRLDDIKECPVHGLGEGWGYDEEGNLVYMPPAAEPEYPEGWDPDSGEVPGGGTFQDWWDSIFGGSDPEEFDDSTVDPVEPEDSGSVGNDTTSIFSGLLNLFT